MITEVMISLQKIVEKVVLRKVCLGEMGEGLPSLGYWLRLSESVLEKVAVVSKCHHVKKRSTSVLCEHKGSRSYNTFNIISYWNTEIYGKHIVTTS